MTKDASLAARVTAIEMIVEALWSEHLAKDPDPKLIANAVIDDLAKTEAKVRAEVGESDHSLRVAEALRSITDRALRRALLQRGRGHRGGA